MKRLPFSKLSEIGKKALGYTDEAVEVVNEVPSTILRKAPKVANDFIEGEIIPSDPVKRNAFLDFLKNNKGKLALGAGVGAAAYGLSDQDQQAPERAMIPAGEPVMEPETPELPEQPQVDELERESESILNRLRAFKMPEMKTVDFDAGRAPETMAEYKQVQDARDQARALSNVDFLSRAVVGSEQSDDVRKLFEQPAMDAEADFKMKLALEEKDPNSQMSKGFRELAKTMGVNLKGDFTAEMGKEILPSIYKQQAADLERQFRAADREMQLADKELRTKELKSQKEELKTTQRQDKFVDGAQKLLTKQFEKYEKVKRAKEGIQESFDQIRAGQNPGPRDVQILYDFIKTLDPESVVREGEIVLGKQGMSLLENAGIKVKSLTEGQILSDKFRQGILDIATQMEEKARSSYDRSAAPLRKTALKRGISEDRFVEFDPMAFEKEAEGMQTATPKDSGVKKIIESRSEEENRKRLEELRKKFNR